MSQDLKELWNQVLEYMSNSTNMVSYEVWLEGLDPIELIDNKLVIVSPTTMGLNVIKKNYLHMIRDAVRKANPTITEIMLLGANEVSEYLKTHVMKPETEEEAAAAETATPMFNEKYTFSNYVVGKSNQFAHAAALAVAQSPGKTYNPLFLYGSSGLGKTHIMHAIGNYLLENRPELKLAYVTSERFVNELVDALKSGNVKGGSSTKIFREKYSNVDVLMIDDIQFIENKTATQEEFFHTFNDLYQNGKQIIVSSDRAPKYLTELSDRLRSRFQSGLIADIQPPELETRLAILRKKAEKENFNVEDAVFNFIAESAESNVREMEGLLYRVTFYASLLGSQKVTYDVAIEALKDYMDSKKEQLTADRVISTVCEYFHISKEDIISKKKNKDIVEPRMVCIYVITDMLNMPLAAIGNILGGRDHTTIIHARDKIAEQLKNNDNISIAVKDIKDMLLQV